MTIDMTAAWMPFALAVAKATTVLACAAAATWLLRRRSAALRHLIWTLGLAAALALPVLGAALPAWQLPVVTVVSRDAPPAPAPASADEGGRMAPRFSGTAAVPEARTDHAEKALPSAARPWFAGITALELLLAVWAAGAFAVFGRLLVGLAAVAWLSRRTEPAIGAPWLPLAQRLAADLGVTPRVRLLRSGHASMPVAAGIFRPAVIMPADADTWKDTRLRIVLLHELAHIKRRDCLTHLLAQAACAVYWFNPLAWVAARRVRTERERACDDLVLAAGTRGSDYADQLLQIARSMQGDRFPGLLAGGSLAMAHQSQLEGRLMAILDPRVPRLGVSRAGALAAVLMCAAAVAPLGALQPWIVEVEPAAAVERPSTAQPSAGTPAQPTSVGSSAAKTTSTEGVTDHPAQTREHASAAIAVEATSVAHEVAEAMVRVAAHSSVESTVSVSTQVDQAKPNPNPDPKPSPNPNPTPQSSQRGASQADPRMVAALTAALKDSDKEVRDTAMQALVQLRDPAIFDPLVQALKDSSAEVREQAAFGLGQMRDRRAVQPLVGALKDENPEVREQAVVALGQLRDPSSIDGLATALHDANGEVRQQAAFALGQIRDRRAVEPLISAVKDADAEVREQAVFALGQLRDRAAVEALIIALKDTNPSVREQIAFALGQIRDPRAIDALTGALKDPVADVRQQAAFALGQLAR